MAKKGRDWEKEVTNEVLLRIMRLVKDREGGKLSGFSKKTEIDKATYYTWLDRNNTPTVDMLIRICTVYGVSLDWLVFGDGKVGETVKKGSPKQTFESATKIAKLEGRIQELEKKVLEYRKLIKSPLRAVNKK